MKAMNKALDLIEIYINGILLLGMCLIIFLQVIFRGLGMPLVWTEEVARFLFVWIIYISASKAIWQKRHLSIDIMPLILKKRGKLILQLVSDLIGLLFFCIVFYYGMHVIQNFINKPQFSQATHTNMIWGYMAPYFGAAISVIRYIQDLILAVKELAGCAGKEADI